MDDFDDPSDACLKVILCAVGGSLLFCCLVLAYKTGRGVGYRQCLRHPDVVVHCADLDVRMETKVDELHVRMEREEE